MANENMRELVARADALLENDRYNEAFTEYQSARTGILEALDKSRTSRKVAKGAGWVAALLTGGLGVEDLFIVPAVNKIVQSLLGIDVNEALELLYRASTQKLLILGLSTEMFNTVEPREVLLDCLIAYKLIANRAEKGMLDEVIELANPFSETSPLSGEERFLSEYDLTELLYREMGNGDIRVSYLNLLLYQYLTGKGLTTSRLYNYLQNFVGSHQEYSDASGNRRTTEDEQAEYYGRVFGLKGKVTKDEIRKKYREFMKQYHPDKFANASEPEKKAAEEKAKTINEAYSYFKRKFNL